MRCYVRTEVARSPVQSSCTGSYTKVSMTTPWSNRLVSNVLPCRCRGREGELTIVCWAYKVHPRQIIIYRGRKLSCQDGAVPCQKQ
jgi:hypothetical protein